MLNQAIEKINTEMQQNPNIRYIQVIGNFLLKHLESNPGAAEKVLAQDKTIRKSLNAMRTEAQKNQSDGVAMLTDEEGFTVVLNYFGIETEGIQLVAAPAPVPVPEKNSAEFDVRLEDLL